MKKLIAVFAAVGVLLALRPVVKHAKQMAAHCKEMIQGRTETPGQKAGAQKMREHCDGMAAQHREDAEPVIAA